jgi:hypothetical protein
MEKTHEAELTVAGFQDFRETVDNAIIKQKELHLWFVNYVCC